MRQDTTNKQLIMDEELFTVKEVMAHLKIDRSTLWKLTKERGVQTVKVGASIRYTKENVAQLLEAN